jgi:hypothetical protein
VLADIEDPVSTPAGKRLGARVDRSIDDSSFRVSSCIPLARKSGSLERHDLGRACARVSSIVKKKNRRNRFRDFYSRARVLRIIISGSAMIATILASGESADEISPPPSQWIVSFDLLLVADQRDPAHRLMRIPRNSQFLPHFRGSDRRKCGTRLDAA